MRLYPEVFHVLNFPRLRDTFARFEKAANHARIWLRVCGLAAVVFPAAALISLATHPHWRRDHHGVPVQHPHSTSVWRVAEWPVPLIVEVLGALGTIMAAGWITSGYLKQRWLLNRFMTERLRQWHFQTIVARGSDVSASCAGGVLAREKYEADRELWLDEFLINYEGHLASKLANMIQDCGPSDAWVAASPKPYTSGPVFEKVCLALEHLRFDHQIGYAAYKLRDLDAAPFWRFLSWPAGKQLKALTGAGAFCLVTTLIASALLIADHAAHASSSANQGWLSQEWQAGVRTTAIVVAILGAAVHTLRDGLAPHREIERYCDYRQRCERMRDEFLRPSATAHRQERMRDLELEAVDEMKSFLRTHAEANFLLA